MRRRGIGRARPSLIGTAARTAVVVKTAQAVGGSGAPQQAAPAPVAAPAPAAAPAPSSDAAPSMVDQLKELAALRDQGVLSDDEFAAAKSKLLG